MDIPLDEVVFFDGISSSSTGAAADADATPTFAVYEEATDTDIGVGGNMTKRTSLTGDYRGGFTCSAANGFEVGKWYNVIGSATIGGVAAKGVLMRFRIVLAEAVAGAPKIDVTYLLGTAWLAPGVAGTPDVNAKLIGATAQTGLDLGGTWTAAKAAFLTGNAYTDTQTLLGRLTATRAGYLDNLTNLDAAISSLNNLSALINIYGSPLLEIPDSSSTLFAFTIVNRDNEGKLVNLDGSPTLTAANAAGTDRSANLSSVSNPSTGRYTFTYSVSSAAAQESLRITASGTVSAEARYIEWIGAVVNYDTLTYISAIKAKTDSLTFTVAGQVDSNVLDWKSATAPAMTGDAFARLGAPTGASTAADIAAVKTDTGNLVTRITSTLFSGITSLAQWLGLIAGKQTGNTTARTELRATGAGSGTFDETTDSTEALRDRGDAAWVTGSTAGGGAEVMTVLVTTNGTTPIVGATVRLSGAQSALLTSNASGLAVFSLTTGAVTVSVSAPGYSYGATSQTVTGTPGSCTWASSGTATLTITMTANPTVSPSTDPNLTNCYFTVRDATLAKRTGIKFSFYLEDPVRTVDAWTKAVIPTATSDANGLCQVSLPVAMKFAMIGQDGATVRFTTGSDPTFPIPEYVGNF